MSPVLTHPAPVSNSPPIQAIIWRRHLYDFVQAMWDSVESAEFIDNWHIQAICEHLEAVTSGQIPRLLINIPPGCSKSLLVSVFWPMWEWASDPTIRWFFASYDQRLSTRDSVKCRHLASTSLYESVKGKEFFLIHDQNQKTYFQTSMGGYRLATSIGGHGTGEHPDRIVVDDPHNVMQAESETERQSCLDWWDQTMSTRGVSRSVRRVIIMQRLHHQDLAGHVLKKGDWVLLCLPMRYEKDRMPDTPLGWNDNRKAEGELLTPDQFGEEQVREQERNLGAYGTAGQLQQRPLPPGGGMFKIQYFNRRVKAAPLDSTRIRFYDRACLVAGTMVETDGGPVPIEEIKTGDFVLTRQGYKEVEWAGESKRVNELVSVSFSNGSVLTGTGDHPVWTENRGWVDLESICCSDYNLCITKGGGTWSKKGKGGTNQIRRLSISKEWITPGGRGEGILEGGTPSWEFMIPCTGPSGDPTMGTFPTGMMFITRTGIGTTMIFPIWSVLVERIITENTIPLPTGTRRKRQRNYGGRTSGNVGGMLLTRSMYAFFAKRHSVPAGSMLLLNTVLQNVGSDTGWGRSPKNVRSAEGLFGGGRGPSAVRLPVRRNTGWRLVPSASRNSGGNSGAGYSVPELVVPSSSGIPVYDLVVKDTHEFFANGILVHNSTADGGCYTAGVLIARDGDGRFYVEHVIHGQWEPEERNARMRATALRDRSKYGPRHEPIIAVEREGGSSGRDAWLMVKRALVGFSVWEITVTGSKDARAEPWSAELASGNVWIVSDDTWDVEGFVSEHCLFRPEPGKRLGKYKDQVDASSGGYNELIKRTIKPTLYTLPLTPRKKGSLRLIACTTDELASLVDNDHPCLLVTITDPEPFVKEVMPSRSIPDTFCADGGAARQGQRQGSGQTAGPSAGRGQPPSIPPTGLARLLDNLPLAFADLEPATLQERWDEPLEPWGRLPADLVMNRDQGKAIWRFLLKRRDVAPTVWVFASPGGNRALSMALGICSMLGLKAAEAVWQPGQPEGGDPGEAGNKHVYEMTRASRGSVV